MCQGLKCIFQCLWLVSQSCLTENPGKGGKSDGGCRKKRRQCWSLSCRLVMLREGHDLACPFKAGLKSECSGMCLAVGAWAGPECVLEMQNVIEKEEASFCLSYSFEGRWWEMLAALGAVSLGLGWKRCSQLRYLPGEAVSQVLSPVGARPRESPKGRRERGESSNSYLWRQVTEGDKLLGQHWEQRDARMGLTLGPWACDPMSCSVLQAWTDQADHSVLLLTWDWSPLDVTI